MTTTTTDVDSTILNTWFTITHPPHLPAYKKRRQHCVCVCVQAPLHTISPLLPQQTSKKERGKAGDKVEKKEIQSLSLSFSLTPKKDSFV